MMARIVSPMLACAALVLSCALSAAAQPVGQAQQPSPAAPGLAMDGSQPVRIVSNTLEVRDKSRQATFAGDVKLTQGDTVIQCQTLVVFYEDTAAPSKKAAPPPTAAGQPAQKSGQKIRRAEAKGDVLVVQKDQTATGENAVFDVKTNTVVITGNVVVTQSGMVTRGDRLDANLTTGVTKVSNNSPSVPPKSIGPIPTPAPKKQIEVLIEPGAKDAKAAPMPAQPAPAPPPPSAKAAPKGPMRLN